MVTQLDNELVYVGAASVYEPLPGVTVEAPARLALDPEPQIYLSYPPWKGATVEDLHTFTIKRDARFPSVTATVLEGSGEPLDVTGASVRFRMRNRTTGVLQVDGVPGTVVDGRKGQIRFGWSAQIYTQVAGVYDAEFLVALPANLNADYILPTSGYLTVVIQDDLNPVVGA